MQCHVCKNDLEGYAANAVAYCGCCKNERIISSYRYIQWEIGNVLALDENGNEASVAVMNKRCLRAIEDACLELNVEMPKVRHMDESKKEDPINVMKFYISQFDQEAWCL